MKGPFYMKIPSKLYHGTSLTYVESIYEKGLIAQNNATYVYLTSNIETAYVYAHKFRQPVICVIDAEQMIKDGFVFEEKDNEYLITTVPTKYMLLIAVENVDELHDIEQLKII